MYPQVYNPNRHTKVCIHRSITPTGTPRYVSAGIFFSCVFWSSEPFILWWTLVSCGLFFDQVDHSFYWELCRLWSGGLLSKWTIHFTVKSVSCVFWVSGPFILLWNLSAVVLSEQVDRSFYCEILLAVVCVFWPTIVWTVCRARRTALVPNRERA